VDLTGVIVEYDVMYLWWKCVSFAPLRNETAAAWW